MPYVHSQMRRLNTNLVPSVPYSCAMGSFMYVMVCSRPDLAYAIIIVSRYIAKPDKEHWNVFQSSELSNHVF